MKKFNILCLFCLICLSISGQVVLNGTNFSKVEKSEKKTIYTYEKDTIYISKKGSPYVWKTSKKTGKKYKKYLPKDILTKMKIN